jgi:hypothetical protein
MQDRLATHTHAHTLESSGQVYSSVLLSVGHTARFNGRIRGLSRETDTARLRRVWTVEELRTTMRCVVHV